MVWDRNNYLLEAERQLKDEEIYRSVTFNEKLIEVLTEYSNKMLKDLKREGHLFEKQLNCYRFKYRKKCNVGKFYLHLKYIKGCIITLGDRSFLVMAPHIESTSTS